MRTRLMKLQDCRCSNINWNFTKPNGYGNFRLIEDLTIQEPASNHQKFRIRTAKPLNMAVKLASSTGIQIPLSSRMVDFPWNKLKIGRHFKIIRESNEISQVF